MSETWWRLPGPSRFVEDLVDVVREGHNIVVTAPALTPAGLRDRFRRRVETEGVWRFRGCDLRECERPQEPDHVLKEYLSDAPTTEAFASRFVNGASTRHLVVWIEGLGGHMLSDWRGFLLDFDHAVRQSVDTHPRLCVLLDGCAQPPAGMMSGLAVTTHKPCVDAADRHDMATFSWQRWRRKGGHALEKSVCSAICVELAGTDPDLCSRLSDQLPSALEGPVELLRAAAERYGWDKGLATSAAALWDGRLEMWDDKARPRSSWLAVIDDRAEIRRRIWRGQIGVLFPFIEEQRAQLLREQGEYWRMPFNAGNGKTITSVEDLEIHHMARLAKDQGAPKWLVKRIEALSGIRHMLAHISPVPMRDVAELAEMDFQ